MQEAFFVLSELHMGVRGPELSVLRGVLERYGQFHRPCKATRHRSRMFISEVDESPESEDEEISCSSNLPQPEVANPEVQVPFANEQCCSPQLFLTAVSYMILVYFFVPWCPEESGEDPRPDPYQYCDEPWRTPVELMEAEMPFHACVAQLFSRAADPAAAPVGNPFAFNPVIDPGAEIVPAELTEFTGFDYRREDVPFMQPYTPDGPIDGFYLPGDVKTEEGWTMGAHRLVTAAQRAEAQELLKRCKGAFAYQLEDLREGFKGEKFGITPPGQDFVNLPTVSRIKPPRRRSPMEDAVQDEHMQPLADIGFIVECHYSILSHEAVLAAKKDPETGAWVDKRCCYDYGAGTKGLHYELLGDL